MVLRIVVAAAGAGDAGGCAWIPGDPRFGFTARFQNQADCEAADGNFHKQILGEIQVYPFESEALNVASAPKRRRTPEGGNPPMQILQDMFREVES